MFIHLYFFINPVLSRNKYSTVGVCHSIIMIMTMTTTVFITCTDSQWYLLSWFLLIFMLILISNLIDRMAAVNRCADTVSPANSASYSPSYCPSYFPSYCLLYSPFYSPYCSTSYSSSYSPTYCLSICLSICISALWRVFVCFYFHPSVCLSYHLLCHFIVFLPLSHYLPWNEIKENVTI